MRKTLILAMAFAAAVSAHNTTQQVLISTPIKNGRQPAAVLKLLR